MNSFKTQKELVDWIEIMHLQNTNGRESNHEMFTLGIEAAIEELIDLKMLYPEYNKQADKYFEENIKEAKGDKNKAINLYRIYVGGADSRSERERRINKFRCGE